MLMDKQTPASSAASAPRVSPSTPKGMSGWGRARADLSSIFGELPGSESDLEKQAVTVAVSPGASDEHKLTLPLLNALKGIESEIKDQASPKQSLPNAVSASDADKLSYWEERCESQDAALAQSERQTALLTQLLKSAKSSIECLGEEADSECYELQLELQSKQESLQNARSELESMAAANAAVQAAAAPLATPAQSASVQRWPLPSTQEELDGLLDADIDGLRRVLAEKEAVCAALRSEVHTADIQSNATGVDPQVLFQQRSGGDAGLRRQLDHWESRCGSLEAEASALSDEARQLRESEQTSWTQYSSLHGDLASDFARLRSNVEESKLHWASVEAEEASRLSHITHQEVRLREETEVLVARYGWREREAEQRYAEQAGSAMAAEAIQEEKSKTDFMGVCAAFTSELRASARMFQDETREAEQENHRCKSLEDACESYMEQYCQAEDACRAALADEQRLAEKCAEDAREIAGVKVLVQRLADKCASSDRRLSEAEVEEQRMAESYSNLQQELRAKSELTPDSTTRSVDSPGDGGSWSSWMGGFKSRRNVMQTGGHDPQIGSSDNGGALEHREAGEAHVQGKGLESRWQRLAVKAMRRSLRDAWAAGSLQLQEKVADLQEQMRFMRANLIDPNAVQDIEKYCEIGERRFVSMEEACLVQMEQSANAAQFVGTELKEAQLAWNARLKVVCKELQEEQTLRQDTEAAWHEAEQHADQMRQRVVAHTSRNDAAISQLDVALRNEEQEVAELRHSLSEAESAIGMLVVHGTPT